MAGLGAAEFVKIATQARTRDGCFYVSSQDQAQAVMAPSLLQDFHPDALSQLHARRSQDSADGIGHAPLAADHPSSA